MKLELLNQDGDHKFSGSITFPKQGEVGVFRVETSFVSDNTRDDIYSVIEARYWIGKTEITENESPAMTEILDQLAYKLDYEGFALPSFPTAEDVKKQTGIILSMDEVMDEKASELAQSLCDKMGIDTDTPSGENYHMETMGSVRLGYLDYYTQYKDDRISKAEDKIVELKRELKDAKKKELIMWEHIDENDTEVNDRIATQLEEAGLL